MGEKSKRQKKISSCFICGLKKTRCSITEFKRHVNQEYNIWRYVDFVNLVLNKKLEDDIPTMNRTEEEIYTKYGEENLSRIPMSFEECPILLRS
jgi:transcription elongation factor Elf1